MGAGSTRAPQLAVTAAYHNLAGVVSVAVVTAQSIPISSCAIEGGSDLLPEQHVIECICVMHGNISGVYGVN